jgi:DNA-binding transcriptional MerR regulator
MTPAWRLEELAERVGAALALAAYEGQSSKRVRSVPDARTIRYYTTLGILDRPLEMRGRTAFYGERHLLQLVAIKRLQARGWSLVEIQTALAAADTATISGYADVPAELLEQLKSDQPLGAGATDELLGARQAESAQDLAQSEFAAPERKLFWASVPQRTRQPQVAPLPGPVRAVSASIMHLAPGVSLVIEGIASNEINSLDLTQLHRAAESLLDKLRNAGMRASVASSQHDSTNTSPEGEIHDAHRDST